MKRYEYKDEKSEKFWEVHVEGDSFTARYGKMGASGQTSTKTFASGEKAQAEADKMAEKKVKKGYVLVSEGAAPQKKEVSGNPDLESAIAADLGNTEAWMVYGDWLQEQGDPRGELVSIDCALAAKPGDKKLIKRKEALLKEHEAAWLGKTLIEARDGAESDDMLKFAWKYGFLDSARLGEDFDNEGPDLAKQTRDLLKLDSAKFLRELKLGPANAEDGEGDWGDAVLALSKSGKLHAMRTLVIGDFDSEDCEISWSSMGDVGKVWPCVPNLREMTVHGGNIKLGTIDHANLEKLTIETGGLPLAAAKSLAAAKLPNLTSLTVWLGTDEYGGSSNIKSIKGIFDGKGLPKVTHLGLQNSDYQDEIAKQISSAPILGQLKTLDLSMGTMSDEGGNALVAAADKFGHLDSINVDENFLSDECVTALKAAFGDKINIGEQEDDDDGQHRYVTVNE
tara:strand:+ start:42480 stop:43835 length:1356 start_codon:yes stop_codon:yes gene_type:complete